MWSSIIVQFFKKMEHCQVQALLKAILGLLLLNLSIVHVNSSPIQIEQASFQGFQPIVSTSSFQQQQPNIPHRGLNREATSSKAKPDNFVMNFQQLTRNGAEIVNVRPSRRTIFSTLMSPLISMREQAMSMLSTSLQGCQSGNSSMWCRFWGMFFN